MKIIRFSVDDRLEMKKQHPCGGHIFLVKRVGSDIRVLCETCGRDMTVPRIKLERGIRRVLSAVSGEEASE